MKTAVVILNWNGERQLARFLPSVIRNTPPDVTIVVADNGSTDRSLALLAERFPTVCTIQLDRNYGFAEGYNRALAEIDAEIAILLNSDVETPEGWCEPLIEMLESHPDIGAAAPKLLSLDDPIRFEYAGASGGFIDALGYPFCRGRILNTVEKDRGQYDEPRDIFWATGACFACRTEHFRRLGGFDADFFAHQEEIDLCWRMQLAGLRIRVEPRSKVYHLGGGTLPASPRKQYLNFRNNLAMLYKNLPQSRLYATLTVRMLLDGLSAALFLLKGDPASFKAVWQAHRDFRAAKERLREKRRIVQANRTKQPEGIFGGSILLRYALGRHTFGKMM